MNHLAQSSKHLLDDSGSSSEYFHRFGLPGRAYYKTDVFEQEMRSWNHTWQMVGRESQVQNFGDYFTCTVGDQSLFVIRTENGSLRAFHNVCPHRGAQLLVDQGNCHQVRCHYHAWRFSLEGNLLGLPQSQCFPGIDRSAVQLRSAQVDTWGGFVFVNLTPTGESLQTYLAGFPAYLEQYDHDWKELERVDSWFYEEPVNWKFLVENYLESYHLSTVHGKSLQCFDPRNIQATITGRHYQICVGYAAQDSIKQHQVFAGEPQHKSYQGFIFPNWMVNTARDNVSVFRLLPLSATQTRFEVLIYQTRSQQTAFPYNRDSFRAEFDRVLQEDFGAVRLLQSSVRSQAYGVLQFAAGLEDGIPHFQRTWLAAFNDSSLN
ncbi:aromatic ring-hydroxylating dioxygenase subunit alpha [Leptolyngbya sp. GB1-A1]|uniref:aromatic ring-hydroxylating oxygenase subunit alpha n=1 Tax=unclassified Leptolyngbya TaxID=2650499 RepID=UPI00199F452F|nr:aromatic ring-hydroxylating dioxygenase subunit alpha [Cyanobacteria bacterium FACHB-502]